MFSTLKGPSRRDKLKSSMISINEFLANWIIKITLKSELEFSISISFSVSIKSVYLSVEAFNSNVS
ncbi:hypothetical protein BpHYR1_053131 [Brachionus plicatilis]|uniref:Uncharacterized protein n=1 Tax=Brachionus plicatilis TaxID=10195 RepID=A0A3M7QE45_BRAPC|nr:hypothetical protein BpHYR1_053131 [Brachionus plicatilis]